MHKLLQSLSEKVDKLMNLMYRIIIKLYPEEAHILRPDGMPRLPLRGETEFYEFDSYLGDPSNFSLVVSTGTY